MRKLLDSVYNKLSVSDVEKIWSKVIKHRAGFKSELSGKTDGLNSHHLRGKPCYELRFSLDNGFCCTRGEHFFGFHNTGRREQYEERVKQIRGKDIFKKLEKLKQKKSKPLMFYYEYLKGELAKYE